MHRPYFKAYQADPSPLCAAANDQLRSHLSRHALITVADVTWMCGLLPYLGALANLAEMVEAPDGIFERAISAFEAEAEALTDPDGKVVIDLEYRLLCARKPPAA